MNVQKFFAPTARDALKRVKDALGADAIVLGNRAVEGGVEILALPAEAASVLARSQETAPQAPPVVASRAPAPADDDDYTVSLSSNARKVVRDWQPFAAQKMSEPPSPASKPTLSERASREGRPFPPAQPKARPQPARQETLLDEPAPMRQEAAPVQPSLSQPPVTQAVLGNQVMEELQAIRGMIEKQLAGFAWGEAAREAPARTLILGEMLEAGFSASLARRLADALPPECEVPEARAQIKNALGRELITLENDSDLIDAGGVFALVGPTGVGKTTTTAKLAARCVVRHGAESLALLTTDGYRIGAHEQLRIYGRILGVPVHVVRDAADLRRTLADLKSRHMILIDTAGVGQRDKMVAEQAALLTSAGVVRRLLLLNATSRGDTLDDVVRAYSGADLSGCIVTKVDEAASLAPALDVLIRHGLQCAYVANGQRVPEDLHLANRAWLLHRALRRSEGDSPHSLQGDEAGLLLASAGGGLGENRV